MKHQRHHRRCDDYQHAVLDQNCRQARDSDMHQTKKGSQWYFGTKTHIGVDSQNKVIHAMVATAPRWPMRRCCPICCMEWEDACGATKPIGANAM